MQLFKKTLLALMVVCLAYLAYSQTRPYTNPGRTSAADVVLPFSRQSGNLGALGIAERKAGSIYLNDKGSTMYVAASLFFFGGGTGSFGCFVSGQPVIGVQVANGQQASLSFMVPAGSQYSCGVASITSPLYWTEWY